MKTKLILTLLLLASLDMWAQIPSINETKLKPTQQIMMSAESGLEMLNAKKAKIKEEIIEAQKKNDASTTEITKAKQEDLVEVEEQIQAEQHKISVRENYEAYFDKQKANLEKKIDSLKQEHEKAKNNSDFAMMETIENQINNGQNELKVNEEKRWKKIKTLTYSFFLPTIKKEHREEFFVATYNNTTTKTNYINSFAVLGNKEGAVVQSEIITDNMSAFRLSFGTVVTATNKPETEPEQANRSHAQIPQEDTTTAETEADALKRLLNGGGNFYAEMILPLLTTYDGNSNDLFTSYTYFNLRGALDVKGFGNDIDTSTGNGSFGFNTYLGASSDSKKFNFFVQGNINYSFGSQAFYRNLGLRDEQGFLNGKVIAGVTLLNRFKVSAIVNTFGSDEKLRNGNVIVGVQILPDL